MTRPTPPSDRPEFVVYCDESRHDPCHVNTFMGIGGLWVPREQRDELRRALDRVARAYGLNAELKWNKVSEKYLEGYKALVDCFATAAGVSFRIIIVDQRKLDFDAFHGGDRELGFYKFYYEMLIKWLQPGARYVILLDRQINARHGRYTKLHEILQTKAASSDVARLEAADSRESRLAQLADLLTGAATAAWCGVTPGTAKAELQQHIARVVGRSSLTVQSSSPGISKFNVFKIHLTGPEPTLRGNGARAWEPGAAERED